MDVGYADNAGAITCHLIGDEKFFDFLVMRHSDASIARLRAPTFGAWAFVIQLRILGLLLIGVDYNPMALSGRRIIFFRDMI